MNKILEVGCEVCGATQIDQLNMRNGLWCCPACLDRAKAAVVIDKFALSSLLLGLQSYRMAAEERGHHATAESYKRLYDALDNALEKGADISVCL